MDRLDSTSLGGIPEEWDDLRFLLGQSNNQGIYQAFNNILGSFGTNFVVQGCEVTGTAPTQTLSEGWIYLAGELLKVDAIAGTLDTDTDFTFTKDVSDFDATGLKTLRTLATVNTYNKIRGVLSGGAGALNVLTGDRYKDQFDAWTVHNITGKLTSTNLVGNSDSAGGGADIALDQAATAGSFFRHKIVGKTVYWSLNLDFVISSNDTDPQGSIVIKNLPWTAKVTQSQSVKLESTFQNTHPKLGISNMTMLTQDKTDSRMYVNQKGFNSDALSLNRFHQFATAPSAQFELVGSTNNTFRYTLNGNGVFEIE